MCENYDVDGIELDFFRDPVLFKAQVMGYDAGAEERNMMTELFKRIREMTEEVGLKRGRPVLIAARVPDAAGYCAAIGIDIINLMKYDLIDILVAGDHFQLTSWEKTVRLGHQYGVPVYPCLSWSWMQGEAGRIRHCLACYRARAMNVWNSGADGLYLFNFFSASSPLWREIGSPEALKTMDKVYCADVMGVRVVDYYLINGKRFLELPYLSPETPVSLKPGKDVTIELLVGDDVYDVQAKEFEPELLLRVYFQKPVNAEHISAKLNGKQLFGAMSNSIRLDYRINPGLVKKGINSVNIMSVVTNTDKPILQDIFLWIQYRKRTMDRQLDAADKSITNIPVN